MIDLRSRWDKRMPERLLQYDILERLGEGARSTIYRVSDSRTGKIYALKHVVRKDPKDLRFVEQMEAEFAISKNFTHPNLRKSYELKVQKTMLLKVVEAILVMEIVEALPLDVRPPPDLYSTLDTFVQAASGLRAMHQMGYVHCDIKPNNILRGPTGEVKVIDFGQSCHANTVKERIQGTPDYIAPEQVARKAVTVQTDIFNLGATLYWALTGRHIPTLYTVNKKGDNSFLSDALFESPIKLNPLVPPVVSELVMQSVSTNPAKRPADMDAFIQKLNVGKHILEKRAEKNSQSYGATIEKLSDSDVG
jgi:eukaryotic-like serine/threonine-protein kinase